MPAILQWLPITAAAAFLIGCTQPPQPPSSTLSPARDTVLVPFATAGRALPLGGDRWAVLSPTEGIVVVADFASGSAERLGGKSDTTLKNPAIMFLAGDTLYIGDWGRRQVTLWTRDGRLGRTIPVSTLLRGALPRAADGRGRLYLEFGSLIGTATEQDSGVVVRTGASFDRGDTVAHLTPLDVAEVMGDQGRRYERRIFSGNDLWSALADGSIWVARVRNNRVDWRSPDGEWTTGNPLPDRVLEVTRYDRELFVRNFPPDMRTAAYQLPFAPLKPPFEDALTALDGTVWLVKSRTWKDSSGQVHVVDRRGRLQRELRIPGQARVIGASGDATVAIERAPNGARLLRFSLPPLAAEAAGAP